MAAQPYEEMPFRIGSIQGPGNVQPLAAEAAARQGQAIAQLGGAVVDVAAAFVDANQKTRAIETQTKALVAFNDLEEKFRTDTDYATAPKRFAEEAQKITGGLLQNAGLDPQHEAFVGQQLTRLQLHSGKVVQQRAFAGEQAQNVANLNQSDVAFQTRYLAAASDVERQAVLDEQRNGWALAVSSGWVNAEQGQRATEAFRRSAEYGRALRLANDDPARAATDLADPKQFTFLAPEQRESLIAHARNANDTRGQLEIGNLALRAPERAALTVGKASDPATVTAIFERGLIPQESGGATSATSPKGAAGLTQMMPDTARAAARRLGVASLDGLSDQGVRDLLNSDRKLAYRLGLNEFQMLVDRYGGDVPAALAGYNAGPGRADKWVQEARAKFGPNYTPEQFASVVGIKETHDYVLKIYQRLGARTDAHGLTENARLRAQSGVSQAVAAEAAQQRALLARMATDAVTNDPVADALKGGQYVDPGRIAAQRQFLTQAANAGDAHAAKELRDLDFAEEQAPVMAQAYGMAPAQLAAAVAFETARLSNSGGTPAESRRLKTLETVLSDVQSRASTDPVGLAARAGAVRPSPLPVEQPLSPQFSSALTERDSAAYAAAQMYGGALVPLRPQEATQLKNWWGQAKPSERVNLAAQFAAHLSPAAARAAMGQVAGDDTLSRTAGQIALRAPETAQKIMEGVALLEGPAVKPKVSDVRAALADVAKGQLYGSPRMHNEAIEAGLAVYAANRAGSGALFDPADRPGLEAAIQEVTGKVATINGARAPLPPGVPPAAVTRAMANLSEADFAPFGGLQRGLDPADVGAHAQLHALEIGGSQYALTKSGLPVMDASGTRPLIVDLAALAKGKSVTRAYASPAEAAADINPRAPVALPRSPEEAALGLRLFDEPPPSGGM